MGIGARMVFHHGWPMALIGTMRLISELVYYLYKIRRISGKNCKPQV
jgi:hypothetical protein